MFHFTLRFSTRVEAGDLDTLESFPYISTHLSLCDTYISNNKKVEAGDFGQMKRPATFLQGQ